MEKAISDSKPGNCRRQEGFWSIPLSCIKTYHEYIEKRSAKYSKNDWLQSIKRFNDLINNDPVLRMNWKYGIQNCQQELKGKTGEEVLNMINTVCHTAPSFSFQELVGFPINAIFIQFMQTQNGRMFFSHDRVNKALKDILNDYGAMLLSQKSRKYLTTGQNGWFSPSADKVIHNQWYKSHPNAPYYGYNNWNQWFLREFKDGMRPIGQGTPYGIKPENVIVNSCQSTPLSRPMQPKKDIKISDDFWLKDNRYSLIDMFGGYEKKKIAEQFVGGTVYQAFLSALFYHRWHAPVDGIIEDIYAIDGTYYLDQSQFIQFDKGSPNNSQSFLSSVAARKVFIINSDNKNIGKIAIIYIGMAEVSSCVQTVKIGQKVQKGQQIGHFMFGGSSHVMIFQKNPRLVFKHIVYKPSEKQDELEADKQELLSYLAHYEEKLEEKIEVKDCIQTKKLNG